MPFNLKPRKLHLLGAELEGSWRNSGIGGGGAGGELLIGGSDGLGEGETRSAQQEEQFAGPEQNVQQATALKIGQAPGLQADVEGFSRAFLDEGAHGGNVDGLGAELAAPRLEIFQPFITARQEVVQAESLAIQGSDCGPATRTHPAVLTRKHRIHPTQAHWSNPTTSLISRSILSTL
jgi:hypothetical protein